MFECSSPLVIENKQENRELNDTEPAHEDTQHIKGQFDGGLLLVWGCGEFGQHGHGHTEDVSSGVAIGCPLWLGQGRMVVEVACGSSHTLVLTDDNKIYSWGNSNSGQLGTGTTDSSPHPGPMSLGVSSGTKLKGITCGTRHSFIWTQDGDCFSFGNNYSGQLGYDFRKPDFKENQLRPVFVDTLSLQQVSQVACGARHSVFLFTTGKVAVVGTNNRGQVGCGDTLDTVCPKPVVDLCDITVIACGNSHSLAADVHGRVFVWGYSKACGSKADVLLPHCVYFGKDESKVEGIAGGDSHSMFLLSSGTVFTLGNNFEGQLGHGKGVKFLSEPREIESSLLPAKVISISVGENTSAAVNDDGSLYVWGQNSSHVIRDDESNRFFQFEPRHVPLGMWRASKVSCGSWHIACVVLAGQGDKINEFVPVAENPEESPTMVRTNVTNGCHGRLGHLRDEHQKQTNTVDSRIMSCEPSLPTEGVGPLTAESIIVSDECSPLTKGLVPPSAESSIVSGECTLSTEGLVPPADTVQDKPANSFNRDYTKNCTNPEEKPCLDHSENAFDFWDSHNTGNSMSYVIPSVNFEENTLVKHYGMKIKGSNQDADRTSTSDDIHTTIPDDERASEPAVVKKLCPDYSNQNKGGEYSSELLSVITDHEKWSSNTSGKKYDCSDGESIQKSSETVLDNKVQEVEDLLGESAEYEQQTDDANSCSSKQSDEFDFDFGGISLDQKPELKELIPEDTSPVLENKEDSGRQRAHSEQPRTTNSIAAVSKAFSSVLQSGSLSNLSSSQQEDMKPHRLTYSPPSYSRVGQLNREKKPARMLRRASHNVDYHLPNQPVHTVDMGIKQATQLYLPHPPVHRTQSSPSLYSSNLLRSPPGARKKSSGSPQILRTQAATAVSNDRGTLPPKPPVGNKPRRSVENKIVFSSGASWRKRK